MVRRRNSAGRYLKYAIGEIILVMIGILLALQVNNWNEGLKSNRIKNKYCQQLIASLESDRDNISIFQKRLSAVDNQGMYLWNFINNQNTVVDTNSLKVAFLIAANSFTFTPNSTAYNNLVGSNGLGLIQSDSLKTRLGYYYLTGGWQREELEQRIQYSATYNDLRFDFCSPMMLKYYLNQIFNNGLWNGIEIEEEVQLNEYVIDWARLKKSEAFKTALGRMLAIREPQYFGLRNTKKEINAMLRLLQNEIE